MKYEDIIKLLDAGYSREEILQMNSPEPDPVPADDQTDPAEDQQDMTAAIMEEVKGMFAEMRKELTAMNIMNSRQDQELQPEDILANIINPTKMEVNRNEC